MAACFATAPILPCHSSFLLPLPLQLTGDVLLTIPDLDIADAAAAAQDESVKAVLVDAVESWTRVIAQVTGVVADKDKGTRPLHEVEFWRSRNTTLSTMYEQLNNARVRPILDALELAREPARELFRVQFGELSKAYVQARDNVKFLNTLERHFKALASGSFSVMLDTLPSLMNGLRMVWVISRHYNTDDQMLPLMRRIVHELVDKVTSEVSIKPILSLARSNPTEAIGVMTQAKAVLDSWHTTYLAVRERIERSKDHRWEFDRRVLFERTDHMSSVIADLIRIVSVSSEFSKFFRGNELRAITQDPDALIVLTRLVDRLVAPLSHLRYGIYDKSKHAKWRADVAAFDAKVVDIERRTETFIEHAFSQLRSAEGAFDLLQVLSRGALCVLHPFAPRVPPPMRRRRSLPASRCGRASALSSRTTPPTSSRKRGVSSRQRELHRLPRCDDATPMGSPNRLTRPFPRSAALFEAHKDAPPVYKNSPPVAGAIAWANSLYQRQKRPILRFKTMPALFNSPEGEALRAEYLTFAKVCARLP